MGKKRGSYDTYKKYKADGGHMNKSAWRSRKKEINRHNKKKYNK